MLVNDPQYVQQIYKYDRADYFLAFETSPGVVGVAGIQSMKQHNLLKRKIAAGVRKLITSFIFSELINIVFVIISPPSRATH